MKIIPEIAATLPKYTKVTTDNVYIGVEVVRGPDWKYSDQDGGEGNIGIVTQMHGIPGAVYVKWRNGYETGYCIGYDNKYDLIFAE